MPPNLSDKELQEGYWLVTHRVIIKKIVLSIWISMLSMLWVGVLWQFINLYALHNTEYHGMVLGMGQQASVDYRLTAAQPIMTVDQGAVTGNEGLNGGMGTSDLYAEINNPNTDWRATFDYSFTSDGRPALNEQGGTLPTQHGFILPGSTKYLLLLSAASNSSSNTALVITNVVWRRMSAHDKFLAKDQMNITTDAFTFTSTAQSGLSQGSHISKAKFALTNHGGYSYASVGLPIILKRGEAIVAVNFLTADNLTPGETRQIESTWFHDFDGVTTPIIQPDIDIFHDR